jgi:hypothetical protein
MAMMIPKNLLTSGNPRSRKYADHHYLSPRFKTPNVPLHRRETSKRSAAG